MEKTIILGDIHGRSIWKDIVKKENPDRVIFLGDYCTTHENVPSKDQIDNFLEILDFKENSGKEVILLRGNHDIQFFGEDFTKGWSGYDSYVAEHFPLERFIENSQWLVTFHIYPDGIPRQYVCSHAGVSQIWLERILNFTGTIEHINSLEFGPEFGFTGGYFDTHGDDPQQSLTWIRPQSLLRCMAHPHQIVGHSPVKELTKLFSKEADIELWLCDALGVGEYLIVEDNELKQGKL